MTWKCFSRYWHLWDSHHKGTIMLSLLLPLMSAWKLWEKKSRAAGDLGLGTPWRSCDVTMFAGWRRRWRQCSGPVLVWGIPMWWNSMIMIPALHPVLATSCMGPTIRPQSSSSSTCSSPWWQGPSNQFRWESPVISSFIKRCPCKKTNRFIGNEEINGSWTFTSIICLMAVAQYIA